MSASRSELSAIVALVVLGTLLAAALLGIVPPSAANLVLLLGAVGVYFLATGLYARGEASPDQDTHGLEEAGQAARPVIHVDDLFEDLERPAAEEVVRFRGRLTVPPHQALARLAERLRGSGWAAAIDETAAGEQRVTLIPDPSTPSPARGGRTWVHVALLAATLVTTTWAGAAHGGAHIFSDPSLLLGGVPYALSLLLILGAHELGHYFAARRHGMDVSLPYFVPFPFGLGTLGAFIRLRSPAPTRQALFDMAVAGPLAGLALAVPALLIGLPLSRLVAPLGPGGPGAGGLSVGSSLLLTALAKLSVGPGLTEAHSLQLHPLAFAGWLGLLLTALNLLPIGQLDGGHIADAWLGRRRSAVVGSLAMAVLVALGIFVWSGLLMWALLIYVVAGRKGTGALDGLTPLDGRRSAVAAAAFVLLLTILLPVPHAHYSSLGIHCPYL